MTVSGVFLVSRIAARYVSRSASKVEAEETEKLVLHTEFESETQSETIAVGLENTVLSKKTLKNFDGTVLTDFGVPLIWKTGQKQTDGIWNMVLI